MRVTFLGTGSAMSMPDRVQTGLLLEADGRSLLVDCGAGVLHRLSNTEVGYEGVSTVLLTHRHLDHVSDLMALLKARWLAGEEHLEVLGPAGTKAMLDDLLDVYDYLRGRIDLRVREVGPRPFEAAGFAVEGYETRHSTTCLAYRFAPDADDAAAAGPFAFSGDSEAFEGLTGFADGADAFAHDCSFPDEVDVSNHPTPSQLGEVLAGRDIGRVYLTHLYPHTRGKHREMIDAVEARFDGDVRVARDGLRFEVGREGD